MKKPVQFQRSKVLKRLLDEHIEDFTAVTRFDLFDWGSEPPKFNYPESQRFNMMVHKKISKSCEHFYELNGRNNMKYGKPKPMTSPKPKPKPKPKV